jgi:GT2 family glycosyltransferase
MSETKGKPTISLIINTLNAGEYLTDCINSCSWVDEIIVVDMHSTDNTRQLAEVAGARVILTKPCGYVEPARNFALSKATCDWVLLLDADERIIASRSDIEALIETASDDVAAIQIRRVNHLGKWTIQDSGWGNDYQIRLLRNGRVIWSDQIHSRPKLLGKLSTVPCDASVHIDHLNFPDLLGFVTKLNYYASKEPAPIVTDWSSILLELNQEFQKRYTPGADGALSLMLAFQLVQYKLLIHAYNWERTGKMPEPPAFEGSLADLMGNRQIKNLNHDLARLHAVVAEREHQIAVLTQNISTKQDEVRKLTKIIQSAKDWQRRSLWQRTFHKWRPPHVRIKKVHFLKRLERSVRKRRKKLLHRDVVTIPTRTRTNDELISLAKRIQILKSESPKVSIIIPVYGQIDYTLECLKSIGDYPPNVQFETIVVNDYSTDSTQSILEHVEGIRLINNAKNVGFIQSSNAGAHTAKGEYLYFLNNDTQVTQGWMDELLLTFQRFPGTGLVGSKLVYPDGTLQEAGGIIWQDGSAWNFGRNQDAELPIYNYAREVDYCSGASIMVPTALFRELEGFDEHYLPAYCEDSDLALKIRDKGYRVIYQPASVIIHFEGISSGIDTSSGVKSYQVKNMKKVYEKWKHRLSHHQANAIDVDNAKDRVATRRVLFLDQCNPTPDMDSGSIDSFNTMVLLRDMAFQVTFIPVSDFLYSSKYTKDLQSVGIEVLYSPFVTSVEQHLKEYGHRYHLIFACRYNTLDPHLDNLKMYCPHAKIIFNTVDLHYLRLMRSAEISNDISLQANAAKVKDIELRLMGVANITTVVSKLEHEILCNLTDKRKIRLMPYSRFIRGTKAAFHERSDIVFVGGYAHQPNIDAVLYFVKDIMPLLRLRLAGLKFYVVGSNPTSEIMALACEDVIILGYVENLNSLLDKFRVSVAPLRFGAGIKGKIGTAMAVGLPVVATSMAAEGMELTNGENIVIADGAERFAAAIEGLYQNESNWNHIRNQGLEFAEQAWGGAAAMKVLGGILSELEFTTAPTPHPIYLYS